ncbi:MAG: hypothetical protein AAGG11_15845 [Pseudomonadota bacterium]
MNRPAAPVALEPLLTLCHDAAGTVQDIRSTGVRESVARSLLGLDATTALEQLVQLLPLCGVAQRRAAALALTAGGAVLPEAQTAFDNESLWLEHVRACCWRHAIDWPAVLNERPDPALLRAGHAARDTASGSAALTALIEGLPDRATAEQLVRWAEDQGSAAARLLQRAFSIDRPVREDLRPSAARQVTTKVPLRRVDALREAAATTGARGLTRWPKRAGAAEVGARALLSRRTAGVLAELDASDWVLRLCAQVLQVSELRPGPAALPASSPATDAWTLPDRAGLGMALTARGPVFHRVVLDPASRVRDWEILAPTDWHFAVEGPVMVLSRSPALTVDLLPLLALSFDSCSAWRLAREPLAARPARIPASDTGREMAHA